MVDTRFNMENQMNTENLTRTIIGVLVAVVVLAVIMVPLVDGLTKTTVDIEEINENSSGIDLDYITLGDVADRTVNVSLADGNVNFTGAYTKSIPVSDMVIMVSDTSALFVRNGALVWFDGTTNQTVDSKELTLSTAGDEWAYFPTTDGKYSSYNSGFEYTLSDVVAVGTLAGVTVTSKDSEVLTSTLEGLNAHVQSVDGAVSGVVYDGKSE